MPIQQPSTFIVPSLTNQLPSLPAQNFNSGSIPTSALPNQSFTPSPGALSGYPPSSAPPNGLNGSPHNQTFPNIGATTPTNLPPQAQSSAPHYEQPPKPIGISNSQNNHSSSSLPALRPVFGVSLEDLLKRDGSAIPLVVYQCIQAVDLFGLEVEGIYRLSGSSNHVSKLRSIFDNGWS